MSAFVVDPETINRILGYLTDQPGNCDYVRHSAERVIQETEFSLTDTDNLGLAMYNTNVNAVSQRYPDCQLNELPGTYGESDNLARYRHAKIENVTKFQFLKSLKCWLYQCSEGNVVETKIYKAFRRIENQMLEEIVAGIPEYDAADWG